MSTTEENVKAQQGFGEAVATGQLENIRKYVSDKLVDHDPAPNQAPGAQGLIDFFTEFRAAFPDLNVAVDHLVTDADNVAFAYTVTGTHNGPFMGISATGKKIKARGMQIGRFEAGKMVERWGSSDQFGILQQIGAQVEPPKTAS
jgi:steroid delta-isomerase-like uncharacterized protein